MDHPTTLSALHVDHLLVRGAARAPCGQTHRPCAARAEPRQVGGGSLARAAADEAGARRGRTGGRRQAARRGASAWTTARVVCDRMGVSQRGVDKDGRLDSGPEH